MKKVLFVFLVIMLSFAKANSQNVCGIMYIGNVTILPYFSTIDDTIKVVVPFSTSTGSVELWRNVNIDSNQITLSACYIGLPFTVVTNYLDTIVLGILPLGNYNIVVNKYCSNDTICSYSDTVSKTIQLDITTNITKFSNNVKSISPNPFSQSTQITLNQKYHSIALVVYDIQGKQVAQQQYADCDKIQLSRNQLSNGLYFLKLTLDDKSVETGKMVISE